MLDHEKLLVYKKALNFFSWSDSVLKNIPKSSALYSQFERASLSILLNIAEGNGKYYGKDKSKYFDIVKGSCLECGACLDAMFVKHYINENTAKDGKFHLEEIVKMLIGLIKNVNSNRVYEEKEYYYSSFDEEGGGGEGESEEDQE